MTAQNWQQIKQVFQAVIDLPLEDRMRYLDEACRDRPELRLEVESLLEADAESGDFMEKPVLANSLSEFVEAGAASQVGRQIGAYRLEALIGEGGMGAVYRAVRTDEEFEHRVAIKLVKCGMDTSVVLRRFRTERQILARLDHPNVARLLDGGVTDDGLPYFVMELLDGEVIDEYCRQRKLSVQDRVELFLPICAAAEYAHRNLVVHRDIKTSNVLVTKDGTPKLLDFGIAKLVDSAPAPGVYDPTATMLRMLTPDYASPEQIRGDPITTASDVYSLGVLLYELLTGVRPFRLSGRPLHEVVKTVSEQEVRAPSETVPDLKGDLDTILLKALQREPERRYSSARELADDLNRYLQGRPVSARRDSMTYRGTKFLRRHRTAALGMAVAMLSLMAGTGIALWEAGLAAAQRENARRHSNDVRTLATAFLQEVDQAMASLPGSMRARELLVKNVVRYLDSLASEPGADDDLRLQLATAYERLGDVLGGPREANLGDSTGALESYRKSLSLLESLGKEYLEKIELQRMRSALYSRIGDVLSVRGDAAGGLEYDLKALAVREELLKREPNSSGLKRDTAASLQRVADDLIDQGNWEKILQYRQRAFRIVDELYRAEPELKGLRVGLALASKRVGRALGKLNRTPEAVRYFQRAIELEEAEIAARPVNALVRLNLSFSHADIGNLMSDNGDFAAAIPPYLKALSIREELAKADPLDFRTASTLATTYNRLGIALHKTGQRTQAIDYLHRSLVLRQKLAERDRSNRGAEGEVAESYLSLAQAYAEEWRWPRALEWSRKAEAAFAAMEAKAPLAGLMKTERDQAREVSARAQAQLSR